MTRHNALSLLSPAVLLALVPAQAAAQSYDLPPAPTPSSSPVYGPTDPERPQARPIPTPTAAPPPQRTTPVPQPTASATPQPRQGPVIQPLPSARPTRQTLPEPRQPRDRVSEGQNAPDPVQPPPTIGTPDATSTAAPSPSVSNAAPAPAPVTSQTEDSPSGPPWGWIAFAALLAALAAVFAWSRRRAVDGPVSVPQIERPEPVVRKTTVTTPAPAVHSAPSAPGNVAPMPAAAKPAAIAFSNGPLHAAFESRNVTVTMMAVTLAYRITLSNRGDAPLTQIMVGGTMEAATDRIAIERQLEPPLGQLPVFHQLEALGPGEVHELTGEIRVPLNRMKPIVRGKAWLLMPIARLRAAATLADAGGEQLIAQRSLLLGLPGQGSQLGPIRLDAGPRVYRDVGQRLVEPQAA